MSLGCRRRFQSRVPLNHPALPLRCRERHDRGLGDRWLICSQWAGRWTSSTAETVLGYAKRLADCAQAVRIERDSEKASSLLHGFFAAEVKLLESDATNGLRALQVSRREQVRGYFTALWMWHRLDTQRWKMSQIQLRTKARKKVSLEVDHSVAFALWEKKLKTGLPMGITAIEDALQYRQSAAQLLVVGEDLQHIKERPDIEVFSGRSV